MAKYNVVLAVNDDNFDEWPKERQNIAYVKQTWKGDVVPEIENFGLEVMDIEIKDLING